ncbi:MAG TPA: hypothetical protein VHC68_03665 [Candidatus Paceibacterota bacterium]|nr:hypothetical protein [Candidatus Paceibacterota bacterium]
MRIDVLDVVAKKAIPQPHRSTYLHLPSGDIERRARMILAWVDRNPHLSEEERRECRRALEDFA